MRARPVMLAAILGLAGCQAHESAPAQTAPPAPARTSAETRWVPLRVAGAASFLELPAAVLTAGGTSGAVNPPYAGQILRLNVRVGEAVKRGQPLAEIMMPTVVAAAGEHTAARTKLEAHLSRMQQLKALKAEGLVRSVEISDTEMRVAEARADEQRTAAVLRSAGVDPEDAGRLARTGGAIALKSPIDGVVMEVAAALGETRDPAGAPLVRIAGTAPARIEARSVQRLPREATFEFVTAAGERLPLRLVDEAPVVDARDGTAAAWFEPDPLRVLPGGLTGKVRVIPPKRPGMTIAPRAAIGGSVQSPFVRARRASGPESVPIRVLMASGADALIESPLAAGTEIAENVTEHTP